MSWVVTILRRLIELYDVTSGHNSWETLMGVVMGGHNSGETLMVVVMGGHNFGDSNGLYDVIALS